MFWGPARLREDGQLLIEPFREDRIDGASYQLAIGREVYVSPTAGATDASTTSIIRLKKGEAFPIPPGQFAFLLTDEQVKVGVSEIAFISIRAKIKYRGLVCLGSVSAGRLRWRYCFVLRRQRQSIWGGRRACALGLLGYGCRWVAGVGV